jgi:hypothetical protein
VDTQARAERGGRMRSGCAHEPSFGRAGRAHIRARTEGRCGFPAARSAFAPMVQAQPAARL